MAWADTLLDASFRGVKFDILKTEDSAERAVSENAYPYVDGADIEDLGRGPRRISVEAIFFGDDYESELQAFLAVLDQPGAGEFVHPVFGSIKNAQATRSTVRHEADNVDQASVSIEFVESTPSNPFFDRALPTQKAAAVAQHGATAKAAAISGIGSVVDRLRAANPLAALDKLRTAMTGPLLSMTAAVHGVITSGLDVLAYPRAWGNDISALVNGILDVREFVNGLDPQWDTIKSNLTLYDIFGAPVSSTPQQTSIYSPSTASAASGSSGVLSDWAYVNNALSTFDAYAAKPAVAPAQIAANTLPTEAQAVAASALTVKVIIAVGVAEAAGRVMTAEADIPTLSPVEIEAVANTARARIEAAIVDCRAVYPLEISRTMTEPLKGLALAVQDAARAIIEARPPLIERTMEAPGNLRLIAHRLYGDHTRAPELFRLNHLRIPNFIQAGDKLNAYAS